MTDRIDTAAARRAWEETTQGEWTLGRKFGGHTDIDALDADIPWQALARVAVETEDVYGYSRNPEGEANARFIARAHGEYPALLDEIERLRGELTERERQIVAWLRKNALTLREPDATLHKSDLVASAIALESAADAIERGEPWGEKA